MNKDFKITFWGVRGSHPVPGKNTIQFGGNTTCTEVSVGNARIIIDAGTGIVELGKKLLSEYFSSKNSDKQLNIIILFTHLHHDHTQGLPFFAPLFFGKSILNLFGPINFGSELKLVLERSMTPPNFPIDFFQTNSMKKIYTVNDSNEIVINSKTGDVTLYNKYHDKVPENNENIKIEIMNDYSHPANGVLIYKIIYKDRILVFSTDVEGFMFGNSKLINFSKNATILVHDAQYTKEEYVALPIPKQGFGHSIAEMAIEVAKKANVKNLILTHHDPNRTDAELRKMQSKYRRRFKNLTYAKEGLTIEVN